MQVETLMQRLKDGDTMKTIAGEIGLNPSTVQRKLKKMGYVYSNSTKEWSWNGEGEEPLSEDITESGPRQQQLSDNETTTVRQQGEEDATPKKRKRDKVTTPSVFTEEEIRVLKDMIANQKQKTPQPKGNKESLHDRLKGLAREEKARKNIFLNKGANDRLEEFCKNERVNKSDIIELALEDFIKNYS